MVRALVVKDLMILRYRLLYSLILVAIAVAPMPARAPRGLFGVMFTHMVVTAFLTQLGGLEERSRGDVLVSLLPVGRADVVTARYVLLGALAAVSAILYTGPIAALAPFFPAPVPGRVLAVWWLWAAALTLVLWSAAWPVVFRWGMTGSQVALNALMFVPLASSLFLARWFGPAIQSLVAQGFFSSVPVALGALGLALVLGYVSSLVSTRLYAWRDL